MAANFLLYVRMVIIPPQEWLFIGGKEILA
jgi:hypothetical protein